MAGWLNRVLNHWAAKNAPDWFGWTTLQINYNTVADWHYDHKNVGPSAMIMLGDFDDGEFCSYGFEPVGGEGIVAFDGHHWRSSKCFGLSQKKDSVEGKRRWRLSCVAFTAGVIGTTTPEERLKLEGAGYRLPKMENPAYPERISKGAQTSYKSVGKKAQQEAMFPELRAEIEKKRKELSTGIIYNQEQRHGEEYAKAMKDVCWKTIGGS